ncbi:MAG: hypothetical protein JNL83_34250 [Myxococcales bacterium]|nr:hypothetical protein [Myxococcales bacterium]
MIRLAAVALVVLSAGACSKKSTATATTTPPPPGGGSTTGGSSPSGGGSTTTSRTVTPPPGDSGEDPCPAIQIKAPDSVPQGSKARVTANLIGGVGRPTFRWSLTAGSIVSGQGTATIQIDTTGLAGTGISASVDLGGLPRECATTSGSATFLVGP